MSHVQDCACALLRSPIPDWDFSPVLSSFRRWSSLDQFVISTLNIIQSLKILTMIVIEVLRRNIKIRASTCPFHYGESCQDLDKQNKCLVPYQSYMGYSSLQTDQSIHYSWVTFLPCYLFLAVFMWVCVCTLLITLITYRNYFFLTKYRVTLG